MMNNKWWYKQLRIIQYNLQMKDTALMDPEKIADETEKMGGNAVVINLADSVLWYESAVRHQKINPYLPKDRDLIQELVDAFHKRNIKVFARGSFNGFEEKTFYQKPQWAKRRADGSPVMVGNDRPGEWPRFYAPCPLGEFIYESGLEVALEIFKRYDIDGAFWLSVGRIISESCHCDRCKKLYFETYGQPMPDKESEIIPEWNANIQNENQQRFMNKILEVRPDIPFLHYYWPFYLDMGRGIRIPSDNIEEIAKQGNLFCTEAQDILSLGIANLHEWNTPALRMKMSRTMDHFPPPVGIVHTCPGMDWRHTCMPETEFMYWAAQIPANGGSFWTSFTGFCDTISDKRMFQTVAKLNHMTRLIEDDMFEAKSDCQVLLLSDGGIYVQGWAESLMCAHIDFDMLSHYQLSLERIKPYPVVIVPKNYEYSDNSGEIFTEYVSQGGRLIIEGTEELPLTQVKNLLGVKGIITCSEDTESTYLRIEPSDSGIQNMIGSCDRIPLRGRIGFTEAAIDSKIFATWIPSFAPASIAGSPPERASLPQTHTQIPLCVVNEYGRGKVMFLPYEPSRLIREYGIKDMFTLVEAYVEYMLAENRKITIRAPKRVMITVFAKDNCQMIHFINGIGQRPLLENIPCYGLHVSIKLEKQQVDSVVSAIAGKEVFWETNGNSLEITLSELDVWDMLRIKYKKSLV